MFGLEKQPKEPFAFDLEKDLKENPEKAKALFKMVEERIVKLKSLLRKGADTDDFDDYGTLLHAYAALQRIFRRVMEKK